MVALADKLSWRTMKYILKHPVEVADMIETTLIACVQNVSAGLQQLCAVMDAPQIDKRRW